MTFGLLAKASWWAKATGRYVEQGNVIGIYNGQRGRWQFRSAADAKAFAAYASRSDFPSLAFDDLRAAGVPLPLKWEEQ